MKNRFIIYIILFILNYNTAVVSMLLDTDMKAEDVEKMVSSKEKAIKKERKKSQSGVSSELIEFNYVQKNIKELVADFGQKLGINILYPETDPIAVQVTFNVGRKLTVAEGWEFVKMILEQSGYTLILRVPGVYTLMKNSNAATEAIPLYINVDHNQLPDGMERIRYMYSFTNINIGRQFSSLSLILANILGDKTFIPDETSNSIIFTNRSDLIKSAMEILMLFDESGMTQGTEIMKLEYTRASEIVALFSSIIATDPSKKGAGFLSNQSVPKARYFSESLKVLNLDPENKRGFNSIVIVGKQEDIDQVKAFIKKYLDIPQEKGKSFFHVVELEWLQATKFADVLTNLIKAGSSGDSQSTGTVLSDIGFDPHVRIVPEKVSQGPGQVTENSSNQVSNPNIGQRGGNKLIIACSERDWPRIESLIKQMDQPQKQVIIEGLVMDLDSNFIRKLGAQIRTQGITTSVFPKNMQAQAALIGPAILGNTAGSPNYYDLVGDLSDLLNPQGVLNGGAVTTPNPPYTSPASAPFDSGNTVGLISGGKEKTNGAWAFFQLLATHTASKVLLGQF